MVLQSYIRILQSDCTGNHINQPIRLGHKYFSLEEHQRTAVVAALCGLLGSVLPHLIGRLHLEATEVVLVSLIPMQISPPHFLPNILFCLSTTYEQPHRVRLLLAHMEVAQICW